jgi:hypothetical protein
MLVNLVLDFCEKKDLYFDTKKFSEFTLKTLFEIWKTGEVPDENILE